MSWLDTIWNFFRAPTPVPIPIAPRITNIELDQILKSFCTNQWLSDESYQTINRKSLENFLRINPVSSRKFIVESFDCDEFSFELMGNIQEWNGAGAFGIVWGNRASDDEAHAWNFFIDENKKLWYVEPQNDKIFEPTTEKVWIMII